MSSQPSLCASPSLVLARLACWVNCWGNADTHPRSYREGYEAAINDFAPLLRRAAPDWLGVWREEGWGLGLSSVFASPFTDEDYARVKAREDEIFGEGGPK